MKIRRRFGSSGETPGARTALSARTGAKKLVEKAVRAPWWQLLPVAALLCLIGTGCLNLKPSADPTRYFLLASIASTPQPPNATSNQLSLGISPVTVPAYLDQPWLVVRTSATEIRYSDFYKWAEYLDKGIQRVLAGNLSDLLGTDQIRLDAWQKETVDAAVKVAIRRFDVDAAGQVVLEAQWKIEGRTPDTGHRIIRKTGPTPEADPDGAVNTMSEALGDLSRIIAEELRR